MWSILGLFRSALVDNLFYLVIGLSLFIDYGLSIIYTLHVYDIVHFTSPFFAGILLYPIMFWVDFCIYKMFSTWRKERTFRWSEMLFAPILSLFKVNVYKRFAFLCFLVGVVLTELSYIYADWMRVYRITFTFGVYFFGCAILVLFEIIEDEISYTWWQYMFTPGIPFYQTLNFLEEKYKERVRAELAARLR